MFTSEFEKTAVSEKLYEKAVKSVARKAGPMGLMRTGKTTDKVLDRVSSNQFMHGRSDKSKIKTFIDKRGKEMWDPARGPKNSKKSQAIANKNSNVRQNTMKKLQASPLESMQTGRKYFVEG